MDRRVDHNCRDGQAVAQLPARIEANPLESTKPAEGPMKSKYAA